MNNPALSFDVCVHGVSVKSHTRPAGRVVNHTDGRVKNGLLYLISGHVRFSMEKDSHLSADAGDVVFLPKHFSYVLKYDTDIDFVLIDFELSTPCGNAVSFSDQLLRITAKSGAADMEKYFLMAKKIAEDVTDTAVFKKKEILHGLLFKLHSNDIFTVRNTSRVPKKIAAGVKLLHERYLENIPITELAAKSYVSTSSFRSLFKEHYGTSPTQYRNRLRLKLADELLESEEYTVSEIAHLSGFASESYFCRYYKKITGKTPKQP